MLGGGGVGVFEPPPPFVTGAFVREEDVAGFASAISVLDAGTVTAEVVGTALDAGCVVAGGGGGATTADGVSVGPEDVAAGLSMTNV